MSYLTPDDAPQENVARGTVFALAVIPVGVIAWVLLWQLGFIASIVGFGVAFGALWLYSFGAGGTLSRSGAFRVTAITVATLLLAFAAGVVSDGLTGYTQVRQTDWISAITDAEFWSAFQDVLGQPGVLGELAPDFGMALLFGALGCFSLLRGAFRQQAAAPATAASAAATAAATRSLFDSPQDSPQLNAGSDNTVESAPAVPTVPVVSAPTDQSTEPDKTT